MVWFTCDTMGGGGSAYGHAEQSPSFGRSIQFKAHDFSAWSCDEDAVKGEKKRRISELIFFSSGTKLATLCPTRFGVLSFPYLVFSVQYRFISNQPTWSFVMGTSGNRVYGTSIPYLLLMIKTLVVGNIPFDVTEEQLVEIFSEAGPVVSFKYRCFRWICKIDLTNTFQFNHGQRFGSIQGIWFLWICRSGTGKKCSP